jgi:beta-lactamase regulating signal transducer with metallopeptidase domain
MGNEVLAALLHMNLAAGAMVLAVLVLRGPARRHFGAGFAYRLWAAVPVAAVASLFPPPAARWIALPGSPKPLVIQAAEAVAEAPAGTILAFWLAGAALAAGLIAVRQMRFMALARQGLAGPAVAGLVAPRIIMPADADRRFAPEERAIIRAHERAHIDRKDHRTNGWIALAQCLSWFNPLIHLAAREARIDQELACDATGLARLPGQRRRYAETLLKTQLASESAPLGCHWVGARKHPLEVRIKTLALPAVSDGRRDLGLGALAMALALAAYAVWAAQPPGPAMGNGAWTRAAVDVVHMQINPQVAGR